MKLDLAELKRIEAWASDQRARFMNAVIPHDQLSALIAAVEERDTLRMQLNDMGDTNYDLRAKLEIACARMADLEASMGPCGCELGKCEQFPEKDTVYYGRLCRDRAGLDAIRAGNTP